MQGKQQDSYGHGTNRATGQHLALLEDMEFGEGNAVVYGMSTARLVHNIHCKPLIFIYTESSSIIPPLDQAS